MNREYKRTKNGVTYSCVYHVAWCSVFRRSVFTAPMRNRLKERIQELCESRGVEIKTIRVEPFRVCLCVSVDPLVGIHKIIYWLKNQTAHTMREEFPELRSRLPSIWTMTYFLSTAEEYPKQAIDAWTAKEPKSHLGKQKQNRQYAGQTG